MLNDKLSKIIVILILFTIGGLCVWFILDFVVIGPGLPSPADMAMWYIPGTSTKIENGTIVKNQAVAEHFELIGDRKEECPPLFPAVSQYCGYADYTRAGSDDSYLVIAWYFNDLKKFLQVEEELYQYLEVNGQVSTVELNINEEIERFGKEERYGLKIFNVTKYESEITSGYFLVYKKPFGLVERDDYFIVYYGSMGSVDLSGQTPHLKELIAYEYYLQEPGTLGGLKEALWS